MDDYLVLVDRGINRYYIYDTDTWSLVKDVTTTATPDMLKDAGVSPNGEYISIGMQDSTVEIDRFTEGTDEETLAEHIDNVRDICYSPSGDRMVSILGDNTGIIWSTPWAIPGHVVENAPSGFNLVNGSGYDLTNDSDVSAHWNTTVEVWLQNSTESNIASFQVNFSASDANASSLNGSTGIDSGYGYSWVSMDEAEMNVEGDKTLYVPVENNSGVICVLNESTNESEVMSLNQSNCEDNNRSIYDGLDTTGSYYNITGLIHSGGKEIDSVTGNITVNLISPANGAEKNSGNIDFTFNYTSNLYGSANCSLTLNGTEVNMSIVANATTETYTENLTKGTYNRNVTCTNSSTTDTSLTRTLNITQEVTVLETTQTTTSAPALDPMLVVVLFLGSIGFYLVRRD